MAFTRRLYRVDRVRGGVCAALLLTTSICHARPVDPPLLDEFRASVRQWTAGAGSVVFSTEVPEGSRAAGRSTFGFDPATGAWFFTDQSRVAGRTPDGVAYSGNADKVVPEDDQALRLPAPLDSRIPMTLPLTLLKTTDGLVDITKDGDANWVIHYLGWALSEAERPSARMVFAPDGRPLHFELDARPSAGREAIADDYHFVPESREPLLIVATGPPPNPNFVVPRIVEVEYCSTSRPELFTTEAVLAIAVDNRMRTQMRLNAIAARSAGPGRGEDGTGRAPYVEHRLSRAGWPLIVTGIIVVAIGLVALFRARMAR